MIPSLVAKDVAQALREFITTGYETDTWPFSGKFEQLVNEQEGGEAFIKGPYVSVSLPFLKEGDRRDFFTGFKTEHSPFVHQKRSWERLQSGPKAQNTIVATGTGSGKTECFLYPLLDHCLRNPGDGIKAIIIYPMNALAGDQAKRFASVIDSTAELKGNVRVGMFVGGAEVTDEKTMSPEHVITCKATMRRNPPDILLTNYKMLDYLLMRPKDQTLWAKNDADTLKYLVVDELHTFDGAQGSDLAMLIRRLGARLDSPRNHVVCVGTSATLGSEEAQLNQLTSYAREIFHSEFDRASLIGETRISSSDFMTEISALSLDPGFDTKRFSGDHTLTSIEYLESVEPLFFNDEYSFDLMTPDGKVELGQALKKHRFLFNLLKQVQNGPKSVYELAQALAQNIPHALLAYSTEVIVAFIALLSHARDENIPGAPFLTIKLQLWARELRRIVARVGNDSVQHPVSLQFADNLKPDDSDLYLPLAQCSECHSSSWLSCKDDNERKVEKDLRTIYTRFFDNDRRVVLMLPLESEGFKPSVAGLERHLCPACGQLQATEETCDSCSSGSLIPVFVPDLNKSRQRGELTVLESQRNCMVCEAEGSLILFGSRAASLSAVGVHQLYSSKNNTDKKLIAFSDSVQDAAHRAGFFSARTWDNNVRMAFAQSLLANGSGDGIRFNDFVNVVEHYWREDNRNSQRFSLEEYVSQFIPPTMEGNAGYLAWKNNGDTSELDRLASRVNDRFSWEALMEFGVRSRVGRSLERTGVACLAWDSALVEPPVAKLATYLREEQNIEVSEDQARWALWGFLLRMKRQGAIHHTLLNGYIKNGGDYFLLSTKIYPFMPKFGSQSSLPRFPCERKEKRFEQILGSRKSWYEKWLALVIGADGLWDESAAVKRVFKLLSETGLVNELESNKGNAVWVLNPAKLTITPIVSTMSVQSDSGEGKSKSEFGGWSIPTQWVETIEGMPSIDHLQLNLCYRRNLKVRRSMYLEFYQNGEIDRVRGHEHTGLLERGYREDLEKRFMAKGADRMPWYENLLSATPTLEMGIDIGDLSSVMLCSVPPTQANYLQRVGRGGRKDGNSFVLTMANGRPHDLFFYAEPLKMMAGSIESPAIFLNASMVLKRQLLAFCFDQWGRENPENHEIPGRMQAVLDAVEHPDQKRFPFDLFLYINTNRDIIWEKFDEIIEDAASDRTRQILKDYFLGSGGETDSLSVHVLTQIKKTVDLRSSISQDQKKLKRELEKLGRMPPDEARDKNIEELEQEVEGLMRLKVSLNRKETLNFMTDDGLLPNYAFPEEGTTLRSVIFRKSANPGDPGGSGYERDIYEYRRSAQSALSELAPSSIFYAGNKKVEITRVELAKGANVEEWRLCAQCNYTENIEGVDEPRPCPKCGDDTWRDGGQLRAMVRLQQVYANTSVKDAYIGDDSDTREPTFFNRQMLIDFDISEVKEAFGVESSDATPFGFEFIGKASFKEINFGKAAGDTDSFFVAGKDSSRPGFRLCRECGMVQKKSSHPEHLNQCQYHTSKIEVGSSDDGIIDCLYLYRNYESEALRILLPDQSGTTGDLQINSFTAAVQLGLRLKFGGQVSHLNIAIDEEPIPGSSMRSKFLVIYDSVPGGTGYLHELLASPENLMDVFECALVTMDRCSCRHNPELDGCYSCLYAYRNSYGMENTSRKEALKMIGSVLEKAKKLKRIDHLGKLDKSPWVDSELEARFQGAIGAVNLLPHFKGIRIRTSRDIINGKVGFNLEVGERSYQVEPQVNLGPVDGIAYACKPDFLITPSRSTGSEKPVAVFLDGYEYHKDRVQDDLMKRQGISLSGRYLTWSLTWYDVIQGTAGSEVNVPNVLTESNFQPVPSLLEEYANQIDLKALKGVHELKSLALLIKYLANPEFDLWKKFASICGLSWLHKDQLKSPVVLEDVRKTVKTMPSSYSETVVGIGTLASVHKLDASDATLIYQTIFDPEWIKNLDSSSAAQMVIFEVINSDTDSARKTWQRLLQYLNIGQFNTNFIAATSEGIQSGNFNQLNWGDGHQGIVVGAWDVVNLLVVEEIQDLLIELQKGDCLLPVVEYGLVKKDETIAEAELAWPEKKVVVLLDFQILEYRRTFEEQGWTVFSSTDAANEIIKLTKD
jgi:DEAD/DEAH box helicase domain-containing protein